MDNLNRLIPALIIFVAAAMIAGALVWFGLRIPRASSAPNALPLGVTNATSTQQGPITGVPIFHTPITGVVTAVGNGHITIAAAPQTIPGRPASTSTTPTVVNVTSNTDIYKEGALKSPAEFQQEAAAFREKIQNASPEITYIGPDQYMHVSLQISDIAVGDFAYVIPTADPVAGQPVTAASIQVSPAPTQ